MLWIYFLKFQTSVMFHHKFSVCFFHRLHDYDKFLIMCVMAFIQKWIDLLLSDVFMVFSFLFYYHQVIPLLSSVIHRCSFLVSVTYFMVHSLPLLVKVNAA